MNRRVHLYRRLNLDQGFTACGLRCGDRTINKPDVTCGRCRRTKKYKAKEKEGKQIYCGIRS